MVFFTYNMHEKQLNLDHMACIAEQQSPNPYRKEKEGKNLHGYQGQPWPGNPHCDIGVVAALSVCLTICMSVSVLKTHCILVTGKGLAVVTPPSVQTAGDPAA